MGGSKSPSDDEYPAMFFQKNWNLVSHGMYNVVCKAFEGSFSIDEINKTLILLIPKVDNPELTTQFCRISLCNVVYKCIFKIIVNRLKEFLPSWVSPFQASFVPGRSIQDNIIIAQEMLHSMRRMKCKKSFMAIKIDLEKDC